MAIYFRICQISKLRYLFFQFIKTQDKLLFRYLFHADIPFLYPPENIRNPKFSDVSGGIEMEYRREVG